MRQTFHHSVLPSAAIRDILIERIDVQKQSVGIVVGVAESGGCRIVPYGKVAKDGGPEPDGTSMFEIGSTTKVFTALLLADMVCRGEVALSDPAARYLPGRVRMPQYGNRQITLLDLANHTSGLPRLPSNLKPRDLANPYADYSVEQLYDFLSSYELTREAGSRYEYSNLGAGLLGHILGRHAGMDYESLVRLRICEPLSMDSTRITLSPEMQRRAATGHDSALNPVPRWDVPTLAGAGALRATADDLIVFLSATLGLTDSPLSEAMSLLTTVRRPTGTTGLDIGLGWHISSHQGAEVMWHNGGTGGFRSYMGYDMKNRVGIVALSNASTSTGVDDIARHLLCPEMPLAQPPNERKEVRVDPVVFDRHAGRYELAPNFIIAVTREGQRFFVQATGQPKLEVFAESEREYFLKAVNAQVTFHVNGAGQTVGMTLHQNGRDREGRRID